MGRAEVEGAMSDSKPPASGSEDGAKSSASASMTGARPAELMAPFRLDPAFEVSVHQCPKMLERELDHVFPSRNVGSRRKGTAPNRIAILTCQNADADLAKYGDDVEKEKDRLLERFVEWAQKIASELQAKGYWCDYIDPCSGLPMLTPDSNHVYSEVDGMQLLLKYP